MLYYFIAYLRQSSSVQRSRVVFRVQPIFQFFFFKFRWKVCFIVKPLFYQSFSPFPLRKNNYILLKSNLLPRAENMVLLSNTMTSLSYVCHVWQSANMIITISLLRIFNDILQRVCITYLSPSLILMSYYTICIYIH